MPSGKKVTKEQKLALVKRYNESPISISECAKLFGLSAPTVIKILDEFEIKRYKKAQLFNPELNESFFHEIDSEAKAYFLGLIIADGNVFIKRDGANRQASISITQTESDSYILETFLRLVHCNRTIGHDGRGTCQVAIRSDKMANDLSRYGVGPNKTFTATLPIIHEEYMRHLIRGIMDGDGNITSTVTSLGKHKHAISFCGTHQLMQGISDYVSASTGVTNVHVYDYNDRHLSEIKWQSIYDVNAVGRWIYLDSTLFLKRKRNTFVEFQKFYSL